MRQAETAEGAPDRDAMDRHLMRIRNFQHQIIQRQVGLGGHPCRDPGTQTAQLAMPAAIALSARRQPTRLVLQDYHVVNEFVLNNAFRQRFPFFDGPGRSA